MTEKALALRLADAIWPWPGISILTDGQARKLSQAAAELRRLHEVEQQRDELLAALKRIAGYDLPDEAAIVRVARAAIAKAEGEK
jgi:hypothetical protein